ncbi:arginine-glutamic acid dipeptide repeats protein [Dorcoceras hygrometricum]|uniref:Arginine-glutamic acid dipeptide repeats protein n=1 Tax=Dorcoceras hygrometricum TaxID=472368 RepID=A0A2Z7CHI4_9LAMI|nr:arginine-glutamic acid dipeptide repeats protein [Dorcoceras hygrometricum]
MASGSSGRGGDSGSKGFDFGSDDILCSYEDYIQDENNVIHAGSSSKDMQKSRTSVFPTTTCSPPDESSFNQDVTLTVEKTMKKYTDDLMRFLEGISSRLSQLELYCYNLDKSIGEMHCDLVRDQDESDTKLNSLEKHIQEVHRSVQILRDKQELADAQKELAKLQLAQKESSSASNSRENEERASPPSSVAKKSENACDVHGRQQLAFVSHQIVPQPAQVEHQQPTIAAPSLISSQSISQAPAFYLPSQLTIQPVLSQAPQNQYLVTQSQLQDFSRIALQPTQSQLQESSRVVPQQAQTQRSQSYQVQSLPPYQQPGQPSVMETHIRSPSPPIYSSYLPSQSNQSPAEMMPSNMPMQVSFAVASLPGSGGPEAISYGYDTAGRPIQLHPSIHLNGGFVSQSGDGYVSSGPHCYTLPPGTPFLMFDGEVGRMHHPPPQPHLHQGAYPPTRTSLNLQRVPSANMEVPQSTQHSSLH